MSKETNTEGSRIAVERKFAIVMVVCALIISVGSCTLLQPEAEQEDPVSEETFLLGTLVRITVHEAEPGTDIEESIDRTLDEMERLGAQVSVYDETSDISRVNDRPGEPVEVSDETMHLLETALQMNEKTGGAFDPTIGPLVDLWGFYTQEYYIPGEEEIAQALERVDVSSVQIDSEDNTVLIPEGVQLDLEALAKGLAAQRAESTLREHGVTRALISAGQSSVHTVGDGPGDRAWRVGLIHPRKSNELYGVVEARDGEAISTSGDYQRYFMDEDKRYPHIIDPRTGIPGGHTIKTMTVVTDDSVVADAMSTSLFLFEPEKALQWVNDREGVEAVLMTAEGNVMYTPGLEERLEIKD